MDRPFSLAVFNMQALRERAIKSMLGRWVSECTPAVAYQRGALLGLTVEGLPIGSPMFIVIPVEESDYANS